MIQNGDEYNIDNYTDEELFNILGLNHPTDRELEAKIIMMINKYSNIQNEDAYRIAIFYQNIYKHFFDVEEETIVEEFGDYEISQYAKNNREPQATVMNFTNPPTGTIDGNINPQFTVNTLYPTIDNSNLDSSNTQNYYLDNSGTVVTAPPKNLSTMADKFGTNANIIPTQLFDYSKNPSGTNPLLKQTIKRIISVDSQFRNKQFQPLSTSYTFNLSEPLKDVLSLKLYSINIPYTWYTVNKAYGANLIYLKGIKQGINNGLHDYEISILPGNYGPTDLQTAINNSIQNLQNTYLDVSFGNTSISYNAQSAKMTFTTNLQKTYNEMYYQVTFSNASMANYLGFDTNIFRLTNIYSSIVPTESINNTFYLDDKNNFFTIHRYIPTVLNKSNYGYSALYNTIVTSYKIVLLIDNIFPMTGTKTSNDIINSINNTILNNSIFLPSSNISYDTSTLKYNFNIILNRNKVKLPFSPNEKIMIELPDYRINNQNLWITDLSSSLFYFDNSMNEVNTIFGKTPVILDQINIQQAYFSFECIRPYYSTTYTRMNNFLIDISSYGQQTRIEYYNKVNSLFNVPGFQFINTRLSEINNSNVTNVLFNIEFNKTFVTNSYSIIVDFARILNLNPYTLLMNTTNTYKISLLQKYFNIDISYVYQLNINNNIKKNIQLNNANITDILSTSMYYLYTIQLNDYTLGNQYDKPYDVYLKPPITYNNSYSYLDLSSTLRDPANFIYVPINTTFPKNTDNHFNTSIIDISFNKTTNNDNTTTYNLSMNFIINNILTQDDYKLSIVQINPNQYFIPDSANNNSINIKNYFGINDQYNIVDLSNNQRTRYISGTNNIYSPPFQNTTNSTITFTPIYDLNGVNSVSSNTITINIPQNTYYIDSLILHINEEITKQVDSYNNISILGSFFSSKIVNNQAHIVLYNNINVIYTTKDYKLVFFDPYSFIKCVATANSIANATWDSTLGWTLGFRDYVDYELVSSNLRQNQFYLTSKNGSYSYNSSNDSINKLEINTTTRIIGDTTVSINTFNYFLIVLDDFIQNHLNDGLVTISKPETQLPVQSYANIANKVCDPVSGQIVSLSTTNTPGNNLTQRQLYAVNAVQIANKVNYNMNYSKGPYVQDIFGIVPIKPPSVPGQTYVEFGGTLQNQERQYFGPVNIHRMAIQLVNDKGDIVDLNGSDWSFSLVCEQLYNSTSS